MGRGEVITIESKLLVGRTSKINVNLLRYKKKKKKCRSTYIFFFSFLKRGRVQGQRKRGNLK